jgi:predicted TIM-barrel fold metal-dependent hydrolase
MDFGSPIPVERLTAGTGPWQDLTREIVSASRLRAR